MKVLPAPMSTAPRSVASASSCCTAARTPCRTAVEPALIGGLSITMTATSPSRSRCTRASLMSVFRSSEHGHAVGGAHALALGQDEHRVDFGLDQPLAQSCGHVGERDDRV